MERDLVSIEAEQGVLGALMHKPDLCESIGAFLDSSDFSDDDHGVLYALILASKSKGHKPDSITLSDIRSELPSGELTIVYASEIMRNVPSAANGAQYATIVKERAYARQLYAVGEQIKELARSRGRIAEQVASAQAMTMSLGDVGERQEIFSMREALIPVFDEMEVRRNGEKEMGLMFGMSDIDRIVRGLRPGNLAIIAGRPGTGKTVLGCNLADRIATQEKRSALIFSLEMSKAELAKRSLSANSEVRQDWIETGEALDHHDAKEDVKAAVEVLSRADIRICETPALPFNRLCAIARFQHRAKKLDLIVIDYIGLVVGDPAWKNQNRNQELGAISRGLKALAKELEIPIVALAQLNRSIETRGDAKPRMSDLRDSGEIEQDADVIIMAHRDMTKEHGQNGITEIDVVKVRHAKPNGCLLQFQGEFARFVPSAVSFDAYNKKDEKQDQNGQKSTKSFLSK